MTTNTPLEAQKRKKPLQLWRWGQHPLVWLAPLAVVILAFYLFPAVEVLRFSFTDATLLRRDYTYTLSAYRQVLADPNIWLVLRITVIFVFASVVFQMLLGLLVALVVHRGSMRRLPGTVLVRSIILAAWIIPGIAAGIVWQFILNEANHGLVTVALNHLGLRSLPLLSDPQLALFSVILANVWRGTAFSMILLYAGLQSVPHELYEAGEVDGATGAQALWHISLPLLRPIMLINIILITIATFNTFDLILPLTGGGPGRATEVLSLFTYNTVFRHFDLASGSVLAVVMLVLNLVVTVIYARLLPKEEPA